MDYNPGTFAAPFDTDVGRGIWAFLTEESTVLRMRTASDLSRPAVEAIEEGLLEHFAESTLEDRTRQMIGHMVRQIMERHGYVIAQQNVKVTSGGPFSRATRYRRPDALLYHAHRSETVRESMALTLDRSGSALPKEEGGWVYVQSFRGAVRGRFLVGLPDESKARHDIESQGYHVFRPQHPSGQRFPYDLIALVEPGESIDPYIEELRQEQRTVDL